MLGVSCIFIIYSFGHYIRWAHYVLNLIILTHKNIKCIIANFFTGNIVLKTNSQNIKTTKWLKHVHQFSKNNIHAWLGSYWISTRVSTRGPCARKWIVGRTYWSLFDALMTVVVVKHAIQLRFVPNTVRDIITKKENWLHYSFRSKSKMFNSK